MPAKFFSAMSDSKRQPSLADKKKGTSKTRIVWMRAQGAFSAWLSQVRR